MRLAGVVLGKAFGILSEFTVGVWDFFTATADDGDDNPPVRLDPGMVSISTGSYETHGTTALVEGVRAKLGTDGGRGGGSAVARATDVAGLKAYMDGHFDMVIHEMRGQSEQLAVLEQGQQNLGTQIAALRRLAEQGFEAMKGEFDKDRAKAFKERVRAMMENWKAANKQHRKDSDGSKKRTPKAMKKATKAYEQLKESAKKLITGVEVELGDLAYRSNPNVGLQRAAHFTTLVLAKRAKWVSSTRIGLVA